MISVTNLDDAKRTAEEKLDQVQTWDDVKDEVFVSLVSESRFQEKYKEKNSVNTPFLDLRVLYRLPVCEGEYSGTAVLNKDNLEFLMEDLDLSYEEKVKVLHEKALENTRRTRSITSIPVTDLFKSFGEDLDLTDTAGAPFYICPQENCHFGANTLLFPDLFKKISEKEDDDLYIVPTSMHEVAVHPAKESSSEGIQGIITEFCNDPDDAFADSMGNSIYFFAKGGDKVTIARKGNM